MCRTGAYITFVGSFLILRLQSNRETHHANFHSAKSTLKKSGAHVSNLCLRSASAMYHLEQHLKLAAAHECWLKYIVQRPNWSSNA